jgi:hypothetical protein
MASLFFLSAKCGKEDLDLGNEACQIQVTAIDSRGLDGCNWLFRLEDGSMLEPVDMPISLSNQLSDGLEFTIGFEEHNAPSICMAGRTVKINCFEIKGAQLDCEKHGSTRFRANEDDSVFDHPEFDIISMENLNSLIEIKLMSRSCSDTQWELILDKEDFSAVIPERKASVKIHGELCKNWVESTICFPKTGIMHETTINITNNKGKSHRIRVRP